MKVVEGICDTITVLARGSVLAEGSVELREHALRLASKDLATPID